MKKSFHIHETIVIDKDVSCCDECPYYYEENDMGAIHSNCKKMGEGYDAIIGDITWRNSNKTISEYCPMCKGEN